jgi:hypothetical protein
MSPAFKDKLLGTLGLFTSMGTLICCAIPSTLILLGFGATVAGLVGKYPGLIWLSENKVLVFGVSLSMLILSYLSTRRSACPIDQKESCENLKNKTKPLLVVSVVINLIGLFYAYGLPLFL